MIHFLLSVLLGLLLVGGVVGVCYLVFTLAEGVERAFRVSLALAIALTALTLAAFTVVGHAILVQYGY